MPVQLSSQQIITMLLPVVFSWLNTSFAPLLSQRNLPEWVNAIVAYVVVISGAILSMYVAGKFTSGLSYGQIIDALVATVTLLFSGALSNFKPYESYYMRFIKLHLFNFIKPISPAQPTTLLRPSAQNAVQSMQQAAQSASNVRPVSQRTTLVPVVKPQQPTDNGG